MAELRRSVCALDCPDACAILAEVDAASGRALRLRGDPAHPVTQGFLCAKVTRYLEREYHPERLLVPLRRTGAKGEGRFEQTGWDEALELAATRLKSVAEQFGPEAVLPYSYGGTLGFLQGGSMDRRFFHRLGASRLERTICAAAGGAGLMEAYGRRLGTPPEDFVHARYIIAWGANILSTNVHLWPFIVEARRRGARFVVIDPVRTKTAQLADWHLAPRPGTDLALALGVMHVLYEEGLAKKLDGDESLRARAAAMPPEEAARLTGVAAADIRRLAREYGGTRPAVIRLNYGMQRSERGGRAVRAISLLPAITGSWQERGGGLLLTTSGAFEINRQALERPDLGPPARSVNMVRLGEALTRLDGPPVKALVVYNSNPAAVAPGQRAVHEGLRRDDLFTVVIDHFLTDTAQFADLILPATTFLEHKDLYFAYGHYYIQLARPAVPPPGACRPNVEIFRELARRMGFDDPCFADSEDDLIRQALDTDSPYLEGITLERLEREGFVRLNVPELPMADAAPNLDGEPLAYTPPVESRFGAAFDGRFPLELVSSKTHDGLNSSFSMLPRVEAETGVLEIHPEDAGPRGIRDGAPVEVFNERGAVRLTARVGPYVRPGVVRAPATRSPWRSGGGFNVNVLIADRLTDIGGGPCFYNCLVEVRPCEP